MIGITNAGGDSGRYDIAKVTFSLTPPPNPRDYDIYLETSHPPLFGEITTNVVGKPTWDAEEGVWYISLVADNIPGQTDNNRFLYDKRYPYIVTGGARQAWQRTAGQWWPLNAYVFYKGQWIQFSWSYNGELFYQGNQYTDVTGGWASTGARLSGWTWLGSLAPALQIGTNMVINQTSNPKMGTVFTNKAIDVTNYKQLVVDAQWNIRGAGRNNGFGIHATNTKADGYGVLASYFIDTAQGNKSFDGTFVALDLSNITGSIYIGIDSHMHGSIQDQDGYNTVTIRKMQLV